MLRVDMSPFLIDVRGETGPYGVWDYLGACPYPPDTPEAYETWEAALRRVEVLNAAWRRANPRVRLLPLRLPVSAPAQ